MILLFILQIAVRVPQLIAFFIIISYVPYSFSVVLKICFFVNFVYVFSLFLYIHVYIFHTLINFIYWLGDSNMPVSFFSRRTRSTVLRLTPVTFAILSKNDPEPDVCSFSKASETLKIVSLALEDEKWFDFCFDILSMWLYEKLKTFMLHDMTHEKFNKARISCSDTVYFTIDFDKT